jgi:L-rhamnose isomerase
VAGFENPVGELGGGIAATDNYPGKARNADELRRDLDKAYNLVPGTHRLNLRAIYAETGGQHVPRNELQPEHFAGWVTISTIIPRSEPLLGPKDRSTPLVKPVWSRTRNPTPAS